MPQVISPCGGGSSVGVYYARSQDSGGSALTGVPKTVRLGSYVSNDAGAVAIGFHAAGVDQLILESQSYIYTVTVIASWDVFVGSRTLTLAMQDAQTGWFAPLTTTTAADVQTLTGLVYLDATAPTEIVVTMAQATGSTQTWVYVAVLVQAVQLS